MNELQRSDYAKDATLEGCEAARTGIQYESNPHTPGSLMWNCWNQGWRVAKAIDWVRQ